MFAPGFITPPLPKRTGSSVLQCQLRFIVAGLAMVGITASMTITLWHRTKRCHPRRLIFEFRSFPSFYCVTYVFRDSAESLRTRGMQRPLLTELGQHGALIAFLANFSIASEFRFICQYVFLCFVLPCFSLLRRTSEIRHCSASFGDSVAGIVKSKESFHLFLHFSFPFKFGCARKRGRYT